MASSPFEEIHLAVKEKYTKSWLTNEDLEANYDSLELLMKEKKIFLKSNLKLRDISKDLDLPEYLVSQVINKNSNLTFREYVNQYRIDEAKKLILSSKGKYTMEGISSEVGFISKSAFYSAFKKCTSQTPTQFLKSNTL